jgi:hypothetical protein
VVWVQIPSWLAGSWHIERARFYLDRNGAAAPEAINREDDVFGWQQDRLGGYWTVLRSPITNVTESDNTFSRFIHYQQGGLQKSSVQFDLESDNLEVRVAKKSGHVVNVRKRHDVYSWIMAAANSGAALSGNQATYLSAVVQANDHVQFVDEHGRIEENSSGTVKSRPQKVAVFQRVDLAADGFRARDSFKAYLEKIGRHDLVPDN